MRLSQDQLKEYREDGFLIVRDLFSVRELEPLKQEIDEQVDELDHRLLQAGKITNPHQDKDFYHRLTALEHDFPGAERERRPTTNENLDSAVSGPWMERWISV